MGGSIRGFGWARAKEMARESLADLTAEQGRVDGLDGLRAFAVAGVLMCHTMVLPSGFIGVDLFFVLSGYLITTILMREHEKAGRLLLGRFYMRRMLRLLPALLVVLAVFTVYDQVIRTQSLQSQSIKVLPAVLFYVGNWVQVAGGVDALDLWGHTWTLAVEEQFYLVWPLVLALALKFGPRAAGWVAAALVVLTPVWRIGLVLGGASEGRMRGTDVVADMLMVGCLLSIVMLYRRDLVARVARWLAIPAALFLIVIVVQPVPSQMVLAILPTFLAGASAALIARTVTAPESLLARAVSWRPLVVIGRLSYAIYLWHLPVTIALTGHIPNRWLLTLAVTVVSVPAALGSWVFVEHPILRLKKRFEGPRPELQAVAAPATAG